MDPGLYPDKSSVGDQSSNPDPGNSPDQNPTKYYVPGRSKRQPTTKGVPMENPELAGPFAGVAGLLGYANNAVVCRDQKVQ